jgi:phospholipid-binding lipoprotein MlaA
MTTIKSILISLLSITLIGCAKQPTSQDDPFEPLNRKVFKFNQFIDGFIIRPTASTYQKITPAPVRLGVTHFFNNVYTIPTIANDLLQGNPVKAYKNTWRLFINTTIGIGGIFDPATHMGLPYEPNDFGITLSKWGIQHSPYLVLPILGASTIRDATSTVVDNFIFSPYPYLVDDEPFLINGLFVLQGINLRSQFLDADALIMQSLDPYSFVRGAYFQNRQHQIDNHGSMMQDKQVNTTQNKPKAGLVDPLYVKE